MVSSSAHAAPAPPRAAQSTIGWPPSSASFCRLPCAKKPIHFPSGEKNGSVASSVPSIGVGSSRSIVLRNNRDRPPLAPTYAIFDPSADTATAPRSGSTGASFDNAIENRLVRRSPGGCGCWPNTAKTTATQMVVTT